MSTKPDPNEFARKVLWNIAGVRAEVRHLHMQFAEFCAKQYGESARELALKWEEESENLQTQIYFSSLREIGLPPEKSSEE